MTQKTICPECGSDCHSESGVCLACRMDKEKALFIEYYRQFGSVGQAAKLSKVSRRVVYNWMETDLELKALYDEELKPTEPTIS